MSVIQHVGLEQFMEGVVSRNPGEVEFHQAVYEVAVDSAWRGHVMRFSGRAPSPAGEIGEDAGTSR